MKETHIIISNDKEKAFDKIQHLFMIKNKLRTQGIEGTSPIQQRAFMKNPHLTSHQW